MGRDGAYFVSYNDNGVYKQSYFKLPSELKKYVNKGIYDIRQMLFDYKSETHFIRYKSK